MKIIGRVDGLSSDEQMRGVLLKRDGGKFPGGKYARRAFRAQYNRRKRQGTYVITPPPGIAAALRAQQK